MDLTPKPTTEGVTDKDTQQPATPVTAGNPGWRTSEFWAMALATLGGLYVASGAPTHTILGHAAEATTNPIYTQIAGIAVAGIATAVYTVCRTLLKKG